MISQPLPTLVGKSCKSFYQTQTKQPFDIPEYMKHSFLYLLFTRSRSFRPLKLLARVENLILGSWRSRKSAGLRARLRSFEGRNQIMDCWIDMIVTYLCDRDRFLRLHRLHTSTYLSTFLVSLHSTISLYSLSSPISLLRTLYYL